MATNMELQKEVRDLKKVIEEKDKQIENLLNENKGMQDNVKESVGGLSGYIVTAKDSGFNGYRVGIQFRGGKAIIMDSPDALDKIRVLKNDLGYDVVHVDNLQESPEIQGHMKKSLVDVLNK